MAELEGSRLQLAGIQTFTRWCLACLSTKWSLPRTLSRQRRRSGDFACLLDCIPPYRGPGEDLGPVKSI